MIVTMKLTSIKLALVLSLAFTPLAAQNFQKGLTASQAGDFATALQEWLPLAEAGDSTAQNNIGLIYNDGIGVLQDYAEAIKWYRLAAAQGNAFAQTNLGAMYKNGRGVLQDYAKAIRLYRIAAEKGNAGAQNNLAVM